MGQKKRTYLQCHILGSRFGEFLKYLDDNAEVTLRHYGENLYDRLRFELLGNDFVVWHPNEKRDPDTTYPVNIVILTHPAKNLRKVRKLFFKFDCEKLTAPPMFDYWAIAAKTVLDGDPVHRHPRLNRPRD